MKHLRDLQRDGWESGINEVVQADCLEGMKLIPDNSIDCVICDLPYGTTACSWDTVIPFEPLWEQYKRIGKKGCAYVLFGSQPFTTDLINSKRDWFRYEWIWDKHISGNPMLAKIQPLKIHENIIIFGKNKINYYPQRTQGEFRKKGGSRNKEYFKNHVQKEFYNDVYCPTSILSSSNAVRGKHPTQKPLELIQYLIKTYSSKGDLILDNCMGSWTTARACKDLGRDFIGFEISPEYCRIGESRLQQQILF